MTPRRVARVAFVLALVATSSACTSARRDNLPDAVSPPPPPIYVAVGASESAGYGADRPIVEAWPQQVYRQMDADTVFINLGTPGSTVAEALIGQLPEATRLQPTVVTVWLNVNDLTHGVTPTTYAEQLRELVRGLRGNDTTVLVANTPPVERLPNRSTGRYFYVGPERGYYDSVTEEYLPDPPAPIDIAGEVAKYNDAIRRVAAEEGAVLVDLHAAFSALPDEEIASVIAADGFHPSTKGHRIVADLFVAALPTPSQPQRPA